MTMFYGNLKIPLNLTSPTGDPEEWLKWTRRFERLDQALIGFHKNGGNNQVNTLIHIVGSHYWALGR